MSECSTLRDNGWCGANCTGIVRLALITPLLSNTYGEDVLLSSQSILVAATGSPTTELLLSSDDDLSLLNPEPSSSLRPRRREMIEMGEGITGLPVTSSPSLLRREEDSSRLFLVMRSRMRSRSLCLKHHEYSQDCQMVKMFRALDG